MLNRIILGCFITSFCSPEQLFSIIKVFCFGYRMQRRRRAIIIDNNMLLQTPGESHLKNTLQSHLGAGHMFSSSLSHKSATFRVKVQVLKRTLFWGSMPLIRHPLLGFLAFGMKGRKSLMSPLRSPLHHEQGDRPLLDRELSLSH